jgi:hypothetical protein
MFHKKKEPFPDFKVFEGLSPEVCSQEAKELLDNKLLGNIFKELTSEAFLFWEQTGEYDAEARETLWHFVKALEKIKGRLQFYVNAAILLKHEKETETEE